MLSKYGVAFHETLTMSSASKDIGKKEEAGNGDTPGSNILKVSGQSTSKLLIHTDVC